MSASTTHQPHDDSRVAEPAHLVLTESERLSLLFTTVHGLPGNDVDWLIVPTVSPLALCETWRAPDALPGLDDPVRVQCVHRAAGGHSTPAWAWPMAATRLTRRQRSTFRDRSVDHVLWAERDGRWHAMDVSGRWERHRHSRDSRRVVASARGPTLDAAADGLLPTEHPVLARVAGRGVPGWVVVPLGVACASCGQPLLRIDHEYPGLNWLSHRQMIVCPAEQRAVQGREAQAVGVAHRQLLAAPPDVPTTSDPHPGRQVYVVEAAPTHDAPQAFYVGETSKSPDERLDEHRHGPRAARAFRSGRYWAARLRPDLLPTLPETMDTHTAKAAERFTAAILRWRGLTVLGGT